MTLQSSGVISLLDVQNEFKSSDEGIEFATEVVKLPPTTWTDENNPFPGRTTGTKTTISSPQIQLTGDIGIKTSYGSVTYSNTSNDNQLPEYTIPINEYYRGGIYVSNDTPLRNQSIPTSGEISLANFYGGVGGDIVKFISTNRENLDLQTIFTNAEWIDTERRKRVIIKKNVIIGGTSANPENYALKVSTNLGAGLVLINYGDIVGYGGISGGTITGGNAILVGASSPTITNHTITNITHNLTSGIYGIVRRVGLTGNILTPIGPSEFVSSSMASTNQSIAHGTGEFSPGDSIYIYSKPAVLDALDDELILDPSPSTEPPVNLCKITAKKTATFTGYISNGNLTTAGFRLSVISGTQPIAGMGIITGIRDKKLVIDTVYTRSATNATFSGNKLLRAEMSIGMVISGTGVLAGTVVTRHMTFSPRGSSWGSVSGTIFTVTETPTEPILPGYILSGGIGMPTTGILYIVEQIDGPTGGTGRYLVNTSANASIDFYSYYLLNQSQNITGPIDIVGIVHILDSSDLFGSPLASSPTSMTAVCYELNRSIDSSIDVRSKTSNFKFFTAGGSTSPGFTVTTTSAGLSALTQGQSVTISGSTASATGTNTTSINTSIFNRTWSSINKLNSTQFFVATTRIDNTYSSSNGSFPTSTTIPFTTPITILNYGRIYGGGGAGANSRENRSSGTLYNYLTNRYSSTTTGTVNDPDKLACKVQLAIDPGFNGTGGNGQGYNQAKTLGTPGSANPNAQKYAYLIGYGNNTFTSGVDPYLDLISIPPNVQVSLGLYGWMAGAMSTAPATWKNVYLGSGSSVGSWSAPTIGTVSGTIYASSPGFGVGHTIKITNLFAFGTNNTISLQPDLANGAPYRQIINFYRPTQVVAPVTNTGWTITNTSTTPQSNPYPIDIVRITTTKNNYTYDISFPPQKIPGNGGDGGNYGESGKTPSISQGSAGLAGYYIANSYIYSNVTWVNTGDVRGRVN